MGNGMRLAAAGAALLGLAAPAGCARPAAVEETAACPEGVERFEVLWTDSGSERAEALAGGRLEETGAQADWAADCDAHLEVTLVAARTRTTTLFSGELGLDAGTDVARRRRNRKQVDEEVMPEVRERLTEALGVPPEEDSDPLAAYFVLADRGARAGGGTAALVLSDFVQRSGGVDLDRPLRPGRGAELAELVALPELDAEVRLAGAGRTADGTAPPSDWVEELRAFARGTCERTGAAGCTVTTS